jgi:Mce-associated membrane protein
MESVMSSEPDQLGEQVSEARDATPEPVRRGRNPLVVAGAALVVVAVVCAGVFGGLWLKASHDDSLAFSRMRDDALRAAEQGSINLTTLDYRNVAEGLNRWKSSTTGGLYSQLTSGSLVSTFTKQAQQAKSVTSGKVLDGVITDLDEHAGKASALIYMDVTVSASGAKPVEKRVPLQWQLTLTGSGWKLSGIPQGAASPTPGQ